jgi:hypothetical protein
MLLYIIWLTVSRLYSGVHENKYAIIINRRDNGANELDMPEDEEIKTSQQPITCLNKSTAN